MEFNEDCAKCPISEYCEETRRQIVKELGKETVKGEDLPEACFLREAFDSAMRDWIGEVKAYNIKLMAHRSLQRKRKEGEVMAWRPDNWTNPHKNSDSVQAWDVAEAYADVDDDLWEAFEAGADALLEGLKPILEQVFAHLCGIQMVNPNPYPLSPRALDNAINRLRIILREEKAVNKKG